MVKKIFILGDINKKLILPFLLALSQILYNIHSAEFPEKEANQILETYSSCIARTMILIVPCIFKAFTNGNKTKFLRRKKILHYFLLFLIYVVNIGFIYAASLFNKNFDERKENAKHPGTVGEFLQQGIEMVFLALISMFCLKYKYFIHNYLAIGFFIIFGLIIDFILDLYSDILKVGTISLILSFIGLLTDAIFVCYEKYMMEKLYYPYWNVILVPGIILFSGKNSDINLVSGFYNYFDDVGIGIMIGKFILNVILNFCVMTFSILTLFNFSPDYVLISISLSKFVNYLIDNKSGRYYFIIFFVLQFICLLFYLEIIELNFCKLNENTRRNIQIRGEKDFSGNTGGDSRTQSLVELPSGYLLYEESKVDNNNDSEMIDQSLN